MFNVSGDRIYSALTSVFCAVFNVSGDRGFIVHSHQSSVLCLMFQETEDFLSNLVVNKTVLAKTDRPAGVVSFTQSKDPNDALNDWSNHLSSLMQLVNKTTHLINKEEMVRKHLLAVRE
jgi:26S proteasome regulatory subunit N5